MQPKKKNSSSMYELFDMNELKSLNEPKVSQPNKDNTPNTNSNISTENLNSLSNFLKNTEPQQVTKTGEIEYENKIKIIKGDFYSDPEVIKKNCELFDPETVKNAVQCFVIFNEKHMYKGVLVLTEFRLIFKERKPMDLILPKDYLKYPLMSISKLSNPKAEYDKYTIEVILKDTRAIRFHVKDNIQSTFF